MWLFLSLIAALSDSVKNVFSKTNTKIFSSIIIIWGSEVFGLLLIAPFFLSNRVPTLDSIFWWALSLRTILDFIATILYIEAIKRSDLSLTLPMLSLTPLFLLITGLVINGEWPSNFGFIGVLLIVLGTYWLNFSPRQKNILAPFQAIYRDRGRLFMLGVAIIWAGTSSLHSLAIRHSSAPFYIGASSVALALLFTVVALIFYRQELAHSFRLRQLAALAPLGLFHGLTTITQMLAQNLSLAVLVISVKRTSIIFSVLLGWLFFREKIAARLFPIVLMLIGVGLIALF